MPVTVQENISVVTYALLDNVSDVSLCTNGLVKTLVITDVEKCFNITTVNNIGNERRGQKIQLSVIGLNSDESLELDRVWTVEKLPISLKRVSLSSDAEKLPHLKGSEFSKINETKMTLLIGSDIREAFCVLDQRRGNKGEPYSVKSVLGWTLIGPVEPFRKKSYGSVNFLNLQE